MTSEQQRVVIDGAGLVAVYSDWQGDDISVNISDKGDEDSHLILTCSPQWAGQGAQGRWGSVGIWASHPHSGDGQRIPWEGHHRQARPDRCS